MIWPRHVSMSLFCSGCDSSVNAWTGCTYRGAVSDLQWLEDMQAQLCGMVTHKEACSRLVRVVDLPGAVDGARARCKVRYHAGQTDVICFSRHRVEGEGIANSLLVRHQYTEAHLGQSQGIPDRL